MRRSLSALAVVTVLAGCGGSTKTVTVVQPVNTRSPSKQQQKIVRDSARLAGLHAESTFIRAELKAEIARLNALIARIDRSEGKINQIGQK